MAASAGCVDTSFPEGLKCDGTRCPSGQTCYSGLCFLHPQDGGVDARPPIDSGATAPDAGQCDALLQNCAAGAACYWHPLTAGPMMGTICSQMHGSGVQHAVCSRDPDCAVGYGCDVPNGQCLKYCDLMIHPDPCTGTDICTPRESNLGVCASGCDVFTPNCVGPDGCYYDVGKMIGTCMLHGSKTIGQPCSTGQDCGAGMDCTQCGGASRFCSPYCDTNMGSSGCSALATGRTCVQLQGHVGTCAQCP